MNTTRIRNIRFPSFNKPTTTSQTIKIIKDARSQHKVNSFLQKFTFYQFSLKNCTWRDCEGLLSVTILWLHNISWFYVLTSWKDLIFLESILTHELLLLYRVCTTCLYMAISADSAEWMATTKFIIIFCTLKLKTFWAHKFLS